MNLAQRVGVNAEIEAKVIRNGQVVELGVITSPYTDPLRNWLWKKWKEADIRRRLRGG